MLLSLPSPTKSEENSKVQKIITCSIPQISLKHPLITQMALWRGVKRSQPFLKSLSIKKTQKQERYSLYLLVLLLAMVGQNTHLTFNLTFSPKIMNMQIGKYW